MRAIKWLKDHTQLLLDRHGAPPTLWLHAAQYLAAVHNISSDETFHWETPTTLRHGNTPNISAFLHFQFYEPVLYLDHTEVYLDTKEKAGHWLGTAPNVGDALTYKILTDNTVQGIHRSVVRPLDPTHPNHRITFQPTLPPDATITLSFHSTKLPLAPTLAGPRKPRCSRPPTVLHSGEAAHPHPEDNGEVPHPTRLVLGEVLLQPTRTDIGEIIHPKLIFLDNQPLADNGEDHGTAGLTDNGEETKTEISTRHSKRKPTPNPRYALQTATQREGNTLTTNLSATLRLFGNYEHVMPVEDLGQKLSP